jgi:hypothetical protein
MLTCSSSICQAVNSSYWSIADYINVFEDTEGVYDTANIGALDGDGVYHSQTTMTIHTYTGGSSTLQRDVNTILNVSNDAMAGLYITDLDEYDKIPDIWTEF